MNNRVPQQPTPQPQTSQPHQHEIGEQDNPVPDVRGVATPHAAPLSPKPTPGQILQLQRTIGNRAVGRMLMRQHTPAIQRDLTYEEDDATIQLPTVPLTEAALRQVIVDNPVISHAMISRSDDGAHATETLDQHSNLHAVYLDIRARLDAGQTLDPLQMHLRFTYEPIAGADGRRVREIEISLPGLPARPAPTPVPVPVPIPVGGTTPAVPPATASTSDADTMNRALELFAVSATAATPLGAQVLARMRELLPTGEIVYGPLDSDTVGATVDPGNPVVAAIGRAGRPDITINESLHRNILVTSLTMVHEAHHHLVDSVYVAEEYRSRELEILFYRELLTGITMGGELYQAVPGTDPETEQGMEAYEHDQLVDYLISIYPAEDFLSARWVRDNYATSWGGLANRLLGTKARYLRTLFLDGASANIVPVLDILESIPDAATFQTVITMTGSNDQDRGLAMLRTFIAANLGSHTSRVVALEGRFGVSLR